jgi:hypothetical protein
MKMITEVLQNIECLLNPLKKIFKRTKTNKLIVGIIGLIYMQWEPKSGEM